MSFELQLPEAFLQSDYVPRHSVFSGRGDNLRAYTLRYGRVLVKNRGGRITPLKLVQLQLPYAGAEIAGWRLRKTGTAVGCLLGLFVGVSMFCAGAVVRDWSAWQRVGSLIGGGGLLAFGFGCLHWSTHGEVRFEPVADGRTLRIVWPAQSLAVCESFAAALKAWQAAGMPASNRAADDAFGDDIQPGWDEAAGTTGAAGERREGTP